MPRYLFTCAYNGEPWHGWQSQADGNTLQDCIEAAFARILKSPLRICAAGRTDAGVHALAQSFHADVPSACRMSEVDWQAALNSQLPASVRILRVLTVPTTFHARFSALSKEYEYRICCSSVLPPLLAGRVWHCPNRLNMAALRRALQLYCGEHDFRRFAARRGNEPHPVPPGYFTRTIYSATAARHAELISMRFCGSGFLYRMVRMLVGAAVRVASGAQSLSVIDEALCHPEGAPPRFCAPPGGLYLVRVVYGDRHD